MGTRAHFYHSLFSHLLFSLGGLHFRSSSSLYSYCGRCASASTAHSSVHHLRFIITTSYPCVFSFALFHYAAFFFLRPRAPSLGFGHTTSITRSSFAQLLYSISTCGIALFHRDSPLHSICACLFINAFSTRTGNGFLLFTLCFCNYQLTSYAIIRRRLFSLIWLLICPILLSSLSNLSSLSPPPFLSQSFTLH